MKKKRKIKNLNYKPLMGILFIFIIIRLAFAVFPIEVKHYYNFDETSGDLIDRVGSLDGTVVNLTEYPIERGLGVPGIINEAYNFDGNAYINFSNPNTDCYDLNCSLSLWINWTNVGSQAIYTQGNASSSGNDYFVLLAEHGAFLLIFKNDTGQTLQLKSKSSTYNNGLWQHIAIVMNRSSILMYTNGTFISQQALNSTALNPANKIEHIAADADRAAHLQGRIDEFGTWNRSLTASEISELYNSGAGLSFFSLTVKLNSPGNGTSSNTGIFNATIIAHQSELINSTFYLWQGNTIINNTFKEISGNTSNETIFNITGLDLGSFQWNVFACGILDCFFAEKNFTFSFGAVNNSDYFNATTLIGNMESFISNITLPQEETLSSATLVWNNTNYLGSFTQIGENYIVQRSITIPEITGSIPFYWKLDFINGFQQNLSFYTQSVGTLLVDDCSSNPFMIYNFSLFDEDTKVDRINGTIEVIIDFFNLDGTAQLTSFNKSYSIITYGTVGERSARVCVNNVNSTFVTNYQTKYFGNTSDYAIEYKFAQHISFTKNTSTQQQNLYSLLDSRSTAFTIILSAADLGLIRGAVIDVQRQYVPINQFISVESPLTNSVGEAIAHLVHNEAYYNFVVSLNGTVIGTFNNYLVQCQNFVTGDCKIPLNLIESAPNIPDFNQYGNITGLLNFTLQTRELKFDFTSVDGLIHNVSWNVLKFDNYNNNTVCLNSLSATSGTLTCTIPTSFGNSSILVNLYSDDIFIGRNIFSLQPTPESIFGGTRVVLAILMYATLSLLMVTHPVMMIVGSILGIVFAAAFHIVDGGTFSGTTLIIVWFIIAGIILIHYITKRSKA